MIPASLTKILKQVFGPDVTVEQIITVPEGVDEVTCVHVKEEIDVTQTSLTPHLEEITLPLREIKAHSPLKAVRCPVCNTLYATVGE